MRINLVHALDSLLWRRGFHDERVRVIARAELLTALGLLLAGGSLYAWIRWPFWVGVGSALFAWTFCGMAHTILHMKLSAYSNTLLAFLLLRSGIRLLLFAGIVYLALIVCSAPASALIGGIFAGSVVALGTYALVD